MSDFWSVYENGKKFGEEKGAAAERAQIVAKLRAKAAGLYGAGKTADARHYSIAADFIERGGHAQPPENTK